MTLLVGFVPRTGEIEALTLAGLQPVNVGGVWNVSDANAAAAVSAGYNPLVALKVSTLSALSAVATSKINKGCIFNGVTYQVDPASVVNINAMGALAIGVLSGAPGAAPWPTGFCWIAADNSMVPMSAAVVYAFSQTAASYMSGVVFHARSLKNAVASAPDVATLAAIDINSGWP